MSKPKLIEPQQNSFSTRPSSSEADSLYIKLNSLRETSYSGFLLPKNNNSNLGSTPTSNEEFASSSSLNQTPTPSKGSGKTSKFNSDYFNTGFGGIANIKTPSTMRNKHRDLSSERSSTPANQSKFKIRTVTTPKSLNNLPGENVNPKSFQEYGRPTSMKKLVNSLTDIDGKDVSSCADAMCPESRASIKREEASVDLPRSSSNGTKQMNSARKTNFKTGSNVGNEEVQRKLYQRIIPVKPMNESKGTISQVIMKGGANRNKSRDSTGDEVIRKKIFSLVIMKKRSSCTRKSKVVAQKEPIRQVTNLNLDAQLLKNLELNESDKENQNQNHEPISITQDHEIKIEENTEKALEEIQVQIQEDKEIIDSVEEKCVLPNMEESQKIEEDNEPKGNESNQLHEVSLEYHSCPVKPKYEEPLKIDKKGLEWLLSKRNAGKDSKDEETSLMNTNRRVLEAIYDRNRWRMIEEQRDNFLQILQSEKQNIFTQGQVHSFFDWNTENKYLEEYNAYNSLLPANIEPHPEKIMPRETSAEKRTNTSTRMVRYYDELDPVVIQPKFMEAVGSMCFTELWSRKNKQDFYKNNRKGVEPAVQLCLETHHGVYKPVKKLDSEALRRRREANGGVSINDIKKNLKLDSTLYNQSDPLSPRGPARHTRAFVLEGEKGARPKTAMGRYLTRKNAV